MCPDHIPLSDRHDEHNTVMIIHGYHSLAMINTCTCTYTCNTVNI